MTYPPTVDHIARPPSRQARRPRSRAPTALACAALALAACGSQPPSVYQTERFDPVSYFSRGLDEPAERACEASRRALLSQGYVVDELRKNALSARKSFQPRADAHVQLVFSIVCAADGKRPADGSTVFVSALQEQYSLKKSSGSASLGVGPIGSVSLPFGAGNDSLIKTGSETIPSGAFYDRFFELVEHYLANQADPSVDPPVELPEPRPLPTAPPPPATGTAAPPAGAGRASHASGIATPGGEASPTTAPATTPATMPAPASPAAAPIAAPPAAPALAPVLVPATITAPGEAPSNPQTSEPTK
ncbi:MAG: DUF2242 domain-containing protein [Lautropia sp.]